MSTSSRSGSEILPIILASVTATVGVLFLWRRWSSSDDETLLPSLDQIGLKYVGILDDTDKKPSDRYMGGDKTSIGHGFTADYQRLLEPIRHNVANVQVCEIGVWYGKSLAMWCDYFAHRGCTIYGIDIDLSRWHKHKPVLECAGAFQHNNAHVVTFQCDTSSQAFADEMVPSLPLFHVIIDDGNHTAVLCFHTCRGMFGDLIGAVSARNPMDYVCSKNVQRVKEMEMDEIMKWKQRKIEDAQHGLERINQQIRLAEKKVQEKQSGGEETEKASKKLEQLLMARENKQRYIVDAQRDIDNDSTFSKGESEI